MRTTLRVSGPAPPDQVWERYADTSVWATWSPQIRAVEGPDRLRAGARGVVRGPLGLRVPFVVDAVDEPARTWAWTVSVRPPGPLPSAVAVRLHLHHAVLARDGGGTTTTLAVEGPAPVVLAYAPVAGLALRRLVRRRS